MAGTSTVDVEKRIKALRKKLVQIEKLKSKGDNYTPEEAEKVASEPKILAEITALERGEQFSPEAAEAAKSAPAVASAPEVANENVEDPAPEDTAPEFNQAEPPEAAMPELSPADAEKRIRALKKKITQIHKLKERGGGFSKEENDKIAAEHELVTEVENIEISLLDPEAKKAAKTCQKKLDQISKLRRRGGVLTLPEKEKISKEGNLKKELAEILAARPVYRDPTPAPKAAQITTKAATPAPAAPAAKTVQRSSPPLAPAATPSPVMMASSSPALEEMVAVGEPHDLEPWATWPSASEEVGEDEGFVEAHGRHRKHRRAKEAAVAAAQPAAEEPEQAEMVVAAAAAEPAPPEPVCSTLQQDSEPAPEVERFEEPVPAPPQPVREAPQPQAQPQPAAVRAPEAAAAAPVAATPTPAAEAPEHGDTCPEKRVRALKKKLGQIDKLKARGGKYTPEEIQKLEGESAMHEEIYALENGLPWPPVNQEPEARVEEVAPEEEEAPPAAVEEPPPVVVPEDITTQEAEKRIKALKKKIAQIARLKERGGGFSPEEAEKVASESRLLLEIEALERHVSG